MTRRLSLRARLFGLLSQVLLKPVLSSPAPVMRAKLEQIAKLLTLLPRGTVVERITLAGRPAERLTPAGGVGDRVLYYFHGGAYLAGSPHTHRGMLAHIAKAARCTVIALDYRLAPEHPYPAAREDAMAGWQALLAQGLDPDNLVIGGDSAGGNLALATVLALRDAGLPLPAALVLISPWTDATATSASMHSRAARDRMLTPHGIRSAAAQFAGDVPLDDPGVSPLFANPEGLPRTLVQVGDDEMLLDDSTRWAAAAQAAGVDVTLDVQMGLWHVWQASAGLVPEADRAVADIAAFINVAPAAGKRQSRAARQRS